MDRCVGVIEFDTLMVRQSTMVEVWALLGKDWYTLQHPQVWVVAFATHDEIDAFRAAGLLVDYSESATLTSAARMSNEETRRSGTAISSARSPSSVPTIGYCAFHVNEESEWIVKEVVPQAMAEKFMAAFKQLPRPR